MGLYLLGGEGYAYDEMKFYIWGAIYFFWTVFEGVIQIVILPRVYDWIESADILENDEAKEDKLFAKLSRKASKFLEFW